MVDAEGNRLDRKSSSAVESLLATEMLTELSYRLPPTIALRKWQVLFDTRLHGVSMQTLFLRTKGHVPALIAILNSHDYIFGGYSPDGFKESRHFYGSGESFVYSFGHISSNPGQIKTYHWTGKNDLFIYTNHDRIIFGSGGSWAFAIDSNLYSGTAGCCATYDNSLLTATEDWTNMRALNALFLLAIATHATSTATVDKTATVSTPGTETKKTKGLGGKALDGIKKAVSGESGGAEEVTVTSTKTTHATTKKASQTATAVKSGTEKKTTNSAGKVSAHVHAKPEATKVTVTKMKEDGDPAVYLEEENDFIENADPATQAKLIQQYKELEDMDEEVAQDLLSTSERALNNAGTTASENLGEQQYLRGVARAAKDLADNEYDRDLDETADSEEIVPDDLMGSQRSQLMQIDEHNGNELMPKFLTNMFNKLRGKSTTTSAATGSTVQSLPATSSSTSTTTDGAYTFTPHAPSSSGSTVDAILSSSAFVDTDDDDDTTTEEVEVSEKDSGDGADVVTAKK
ncbi:TLD protein [Gregarina niphandrodes]|uniref:Oxidation resistance protein 1 n=1 Tax=Gregarina niphandrodes TaxID=110365 RepID=A0A023B4P8_GRENI|nr:TLD protein [Gregarina niphandrodes]EZG57132.1 TLD protein [Gregarina niphandrodes]|eukprot:XP_011131091.1 TLD protein [Gregarina niphandrodes]